MAYTEPPTFVSSTVLTAADQNILSEDIRYLKGQTDAAAASAVKLNRTSAQSIPNDTWTEVTWNNELMDIGGWWSSGTDIIAPSDHPAGVTTYFVDIPVVAVFATNATGSRGVRILLDGSVIEGNQYSIGAPSADPASMSFNMSLSEVAEAGVITMEVYQSSGGALNLSGCVITCMRLFPSS